MDGRTEPSRVDILEIDIDTRMLDLWNEVIKVETWDINAVAIYMRAAYGKGYCDSLTESQRGQLPIEHGYKVPKIQPPPPNH